MADQTVARLDIARQRRAILVQQLAPSADRLADLRDALSNADALYVQANAAWKLAKDRAAAAYVSWIALERASSGLFLEQRALCEARARAFHALNTAETAARTIGGAA